MGDAVSKVEQSAAWRGLKGSAVGSCAGHLRKTCDFSWFRAGLSDVPSAKSKVSKYGWNQKATFVLPGK
jgi:hypothetical protein